MNTNRITCCITLITGITIALNAIGADVEFQLDHSDSTPSFVIYNADTNTLISCTGEGDVTVTGQIYAASFSGSGAGLTVLNGDALEFGSVTAGKLDTASVTESKIATGAVSSDKIANNTIQAADVDEDDFDGTFWKVDGNSGAGTDAFIGTTDNEPLELKANGQRALLLVPHVSGPNVIGGSTNNAVNVSAYATVISGGRSNSINNSDDCVIAGGAGNAMSKYADGSAIGGGHNNFAGMNALNGVIAGGHGNSIGADTTEAVVSGGNGNIANGSYEVIGGGFSNQANGLAGTISGGYGNEVESMYGAVAGGRNNTANAFSSVGGGEDNYSHAYYAVIGGGDNNRIDHELFGSVIGGGLNNSISNGYYNSIGGGQNNRNDGTSSAIGGGAGNSVSPGADYCFIGGGSNNTCSSDYTVALCGHDNEASMRGVVLGGEFNYSQGNSVIGAGRYNWMSADYSVLMGGESNEVHGFWACIPGGKDNAANGNYSFAAGYRAKANHQGTFVWSDIQNSDYESTTDNQFSIRAQNGVRISEDLESTGTLAHRGDRYADNNIIAWAKVYANGTDSGGHSFGISAITNNSTGTYTITLDVFLDSWNNIVATVTPEVESMPTSAAAARLSYVNNAVTDNSTMRVYITDGNYAAVNNDFLIIVTGR